MKNFGQTNKHLKISARYPQGGCLRKKRGYNSRNMHLRLVVPKQFVRILAGMRMIILKPLSVQEREAAEDAPSRGHPGDLGIPREKGGEKEKQRQNG